MTLYIFRRLLLLIPVLLGISFLTFAILKITPGDPVQIMLGMNATPERVQMLRDQLHLNDPFLVQYGRYLWNALHGDLGQSIRGQTPVMTEILSRFPSTLELTVAAISFAVLAGVGAGVLAATTKKRWLDKATMVFTLIAFSIPSFWLAIILILVFGLKLKWVSVLGGTGFVNLILPAFSLAVGPAAVLARITRSSIMEVMHEDYIRTARAKGVAEQTITYVHILRNALIPVVTIIGLQFAGMLGGAVFIESVFARPGLGRYAINAIGTRDFPQIQGMVLFTAIVYALINLGVDLLYSVLDPRISYRGEG